MQRVARATGTEGSQRTSIATITKAALMTAVAYVAILALIHFGFGINVPVYFIVDAASHPELVARLDDLALLGFLVAALHAVIIILAAIPWTAGCDNQHGGHTCLLLGHRSRPDSAVPRDPEA